MIDPNELCVCFHRASEHKENGDCIHGCNCDQIAEDAKKDKGVGLAIELWLRQNVEFDGKGNFRLMSK